MGTIRKKKIGTGTRLRSRGKNATKKYVLTNRIVIVAQLVERTLSISEVGDSKPIVGIFYLYFLSKVLVEKTKINKRRGREGPF